jgi:hypothetical protein
MKKTFLVIFSLAIFITLFVGNSRSAKAYSNNNLIDDAVFDNSGSMDTAAIQAFLNKFPNSCLKNYSSTMPDADPYKAYFTYAGSGTAAQIIRRVADVWGINPQVILAKLEQEESLVRGNAGCPEWRYNSAMGMGCPDGGACPAPGYEGFTKQVTKGAWQLKWNKEAAIGNVNWQGNGGLTYGGYMTQGIRKRCNTCASVYFDGYATIDNTLVHMDTGATASLYRYTPHVPSSFPVLFETFFGAGSTMATYNNVAINAIGQNLVPGGVLRPGDYLISTTGNSILTLQADGNLVLYRNGVAVWYSGTNGRPATGAEMQSDGNLVITFVYGDKWSTSTAGSPSSTLKLQSDGNLVIYNVDNRAIWNSGTWLSQAQLTQMNSTFTTGVLYRGQQLYSPNGKYRAILQSDGNFVLYSPSRALWSSNTWNTAAKSLAMQADGNLVVYTESRQPLWNSNTWRRGASRLKMQDDGNLVIYSSTGVATWYTGTVGQQ